MDPEDWKLLNSLVSEKTIALFSIESVVQRQIKKTKNAQLYIPDGQAGQVLDTIHGVFKKLRDMSCGICGLTGHTNSSCWVNGQIYNTCRSEGPAAMEANFLWREALKIRRTVRDEAVRQETAAMKQKALASARLCASSYRISKASRKLGDR